MKLDHLSTYTLELDKVKFFFHDLLNLKFRFCPIFNFPRYRLYGGDPKQESVHLIGRNNEQHPLNISEDTGAYYHITFKLTPILKLVCQSKKRVGRIGKAAYLPAFPSNIRKRPQL